MDDRVTTGRPMSGLTVILIATVIAGAASYVITWLVPRSIGFVDYAAFAVFWSSIYLVVGALSGMQQEITRATRPLPSDAHSQVSRARNFGLIAGVVVAVAVIATAPAWVDAVFPAEGWLMVWPLALGASGFVMVAVLGGSLSGLSAWRPVALLIASDALLRLVAIGIALGFGGDVVALAWAVAVPFPAVIILLWPLIRSSIVGRSQVDLGYRALTWNVARTILAAAATSAMVSGLPLLLRLTSPEVGDAELALVVLSATLVRAPLIVVSMSVSNYLIVTFRDAGSRFIGLLLRLGLAVFGVGVLLTLAGWVAGPTVFAFLFPDEQTPTGWFIALLVVSSTLVGAMCVAAPAVLSRSEHRVFTAGWAVGVVVTVAALLMPFDFITRTVIGLEAGPAAGLLVYVGYFIVAARRPTSST